MAKEKKVKPRDMVKVQWVGGSKDPFHKRGDVSSIHAEQAEKMINAGKAVKEDAELPAETVGAPAATDGGGGLQL